MAAAPVPDRRRTRRRWWFALAALVVLVGAGIGAYLWVFDHWFVGVDEETETVSVYRGINASVLGVDLYREETGTDVAVADLSSDVRSKVADGIAVDDRAAAEDRVDMLREQSLPQCEPEPEPTPTTSAPAPEPSPLVPPGLPSSPPAVGSLPETSTPTTATGTDTSTTGPTSSESTSSSGTGRDCREAE